MPKRQQTRNQITTLNSKLYNESKFAKCFRTINIHEKEVRRRIDFNGSREIIKNINISILSPN